VEDSFFSFLFFAAQSVYFKTFFWNPVFTFVLQDLPSTDAEARDAETRDVTVASALAIEDHVSSEEVEVSTEIYDSPASPVDTDEL
jgi:hypothetical protein